MYSCTLFFDEEHHVNLEKKPEDKFNMRDVRVFKDTYNGLDKNKQQAYIDKTEKNKQIARILKLLFYRHVKVIQAMSLVKYDYPEIEELGSYVTQSFITTEIETLYESEDQFTYYKRVSQCHKERLSYYKAKLEEIRSKEGLDGLNEEMKELECQLIIKDNSFSLYELKVLLPEKKKILELFIKTVPKVISLDNVDILKVNKTTLSELLKPSPIDTTDDSNNMILIDEILKPVGYKERALLLEESIPDKWKVNRSQHDWTIQARADFLDINRDKYLRYIGRKK